MKNLVIPIVLSFLVGCQSVYLNDSEIATIYVDDKSQYVTVTMPSIRKIAHNPFMVFDIENYRGRDIGVGVGIRNQANTLFVFDDKLSDWKSQTLKLSDGNINLWAIKSLTVVNDKLLVGLSNGSILLHDSRLDRWVKIAELQSEITHLHFTDAGVGYAIGRTFTGCQIFKTVSAISEWKEVYANPDSGNCFDLEFVDENTIIAAVNDEYLLISDNAGRSWNRREIEPAGLRQNNEDWVEYNNNGARDIYKSPNGDVWVVGERGSLYFSDDRAETWSRPSELPQSALAHDFNSIEFSKVGTGIAIGDDGYAIVTRDFGRSWAEIPKNEFLINNGQGEASKEFDSLRRAAFRLDNFLLIGRHGVYQVRVDNK